MSFQKKPLTKNQIKLIYNPHAGAKRRLLPNPYSTVISLEDIRSLLKKYQLEADFYPTEYPGHATKLAEDAIKEGYKTVLVAGGDGTVGEVANGLINSEITLGILPLGSYMNVAHMLSIPLDIEKAVMLIKVARIRKIDVGSVISIGDNALRRPYYFLESCGFGLEALLHEHVHAMEEGNIFEIFLLIKTLFSYLRYKIEIIIDGQKITTRATNINISNGPYSGPAIAIAPDAKLNDHLLTVTIFKMGKYDLLYYFLLKFFGYKRKVRTKIFKARSVKILTKDPQRVHADARLYGQTPIELGIVPNALSIFAGFPESNEEIISLKKRTLLDP